MRVVDGNASCNRWRQGRAAVGLAALCIALWQGASAAGAQVLYGSLTGQVTDATGAAIPNAQITATNQANGESRSTTSAAHGEYTIPNLEPGPYTVAVAPVASFGGYTQKNVAVEVNTVVRVNATLQPASVNAEVTVNTSAPIMQTETAEVNHQISETILANAPISSSQGRNYQQLYTLIPGAANVVEQNSTASNPSRAMSLNVNGVEDMSNTTRIDGAVNYYGWLPYLVAYVPPVDSIQTVNVTTSSFNAEQGVAGGASINVITKSGTNHLHGSLWEYNQLFNTNARTYTAPPPPAAIPKNIFNEFGFSIGGPVYIPKILKGKDKLFFFQDFQRTTRRQLITGLQTVPDAAMLGGNFAEVMSGLSSPAANTILYDPQPGGVPVPAGTPNSHNGYYDVGYRPTFDSEYGTSCNCIPTGRIAYAASTMLALLQPISQTVGTPTASQLSNQLANDFNGNGTLSYNRNESDSKITYNPSDRTSIFGRYSIEPFTVLDPQELGAAGGGTFDGGQPGLGAGRIQNVGLGFSHVLTSNLVIDGDAGYTRQVTGAQSAIDIADGDFGVNTLKIPGTNGPGINYVGQPLLAFTGFSSLGNANGANPFLFRDNQFTGDVNVSWTKGKHATKYGFTYYHFDLNHFQPTSGSGINHPSGGFEFQGGMTTGPANVSNTGVPDNINAYTSLADFLLGLPNNGTSSAVAKPSQVTNPNSLRWTELAAYAQDQWTITPKLTLNYGVRYENYPAIYRDRPGVARLDPTLPQTANVEIGGINGNPKGAGYSDSWFFAPRLGIAYRINDRLVVRTGAGLTSDPDSMRFLRDAFPEDLAPSYAGQATDTIAYDPVSGGALPLTVGIPAQAPPDLSSGFVSLPVSGGTNTSPKDYRRGYIESWNFFVEQDLGNHFVMNVGYVGTHAVRELFGYTLNAAPLPTGASLCMPNGQFNPSSGLTGACNFQANTIVNLENCPSPTTASGSICYNTGGITWNAPSQSAMYNGLQAQLSRNAGRLAQFGLVYTWSHAIDFEDNGAGSGSEGVKFSSPEYFRLNRADAGYDRTNNLQFWTIYHLPFGHGQRWANHGVASAVFGGLQLNGQIGHTSGAPFSVSPASNQINDPGNTEYADLIAPYHQIGGHNRTPGNSTVSGGQPWFDPTSFANPVEPLYGSTNVGKPGYVDCSIPSCMVAPHFGNTHRNEFRGPGQTVINASVFRGFHVYRESQFQIRVEAFNLLNHALINSPNVTVGGGTFGYITSFGNTRSLQFSGRFNF
ncbi:MAG TPA: TonB-dependent receptor [Acidobacteriaceae bacterium]|nr:TonB-dependent receptor [Acidobacteriaceae bacterium]